MTELRITGTSLFDRGDILLELSDGTAAIFSAEFLLQNLEKATVRLSEPDEDD